MKSKKQLFFRLSVGLGTLLTLLSFQNCSSGFRSDALNSSLSTSTLSSSSDQPPSTPEPTPTTPNPAPAPGENPSLPLPGPLPVGQTFDITTLKPNGAAELTSLSACPPGSGVTSGCDEMTDYGSMLYDASQTRFLLYGGGHGLGRSSSLMTFDLKTQRWGAAYVGTDYSHMYTAQDQQDPDNTDLKCFYKDTGAPVVRHTYDMMEIVPDLKGRPTLLMLTNGGVSFTLPSGRAECTIGHYDIQDRRWTWTNTTTGPVYYYASSSAYDPVSKKVLIMGNGPNASPSQIYTYDPVTTELKTQRYTEEYGYDNNLTYFPPNDRFYLIKRGTPNQVFEIAVDRNDFSKSTISPLALSGTPYADITVASGWKYDPDQRVIAGGIANGRFYYFDPVQKIWGSVLMNIQVGGHQITATAFHNIDYDTKNKIWVFVDNASKSTWAFRFQKP